MNIFNRIFTIVGLAVLLALGAAVLLAPGQMLAWAHAAANSMRIQLFPGWADLTRMLVRVAAAIVWVAAISGLLWLELRRPPARMLTVVRRDGGAAIQVAASTVESRIDDAVDGLPGVIATHTTVRPRSKGVDVNVDVRATRETDPVSRAAEAAELVRGIVQNDLGLRLAGDPQIAVRTSAGVAKVDRKPSIFARFNAKPLKPEPTTLTTTPPQEEPSDDARTS